MNILHGFRRGDPDSTSSVLPNDHFQQEQAVLNAPSLRFSDTNVEGKIFLGLAAASVVVDADLPHLSDGRKNRYAVGGIPIGIGDDRHIITVAGSRAGKGRAALIPNLITYPGSMLVIDPKGDLAHITADHRRQMGQEVYVVDPFDAAGSAVRRYAANHNCIDMLNPSGRSLRADGGLIGDALVFSEGENDPHWNDSARNLVEGLSLHVATSPLYATRRNLVQVHDLLWRALVPAGNDAPAGYALQQEMSANLSAGGAVLNSARDFYERSDRERDSVLSTARRHLHFLGYEELQKTLHNSSFDLRDLKRKPVTIYLILPAMRIGTCSRWLRLFVNMTLSAMEMEKTKPRYPVLLCLDEFAVLGHMKTIEDAAGQIAGLGCKLWPVLQDLGQLKSLYRDRWETFMGNAGVLQFFGNSELTTLDWISHRLGKTTVIAPSQATPTYYDAAKSGATGKSWTHAVADLMTPSEIARYFGRDDPLLRQLIIRPTALPMVLHRAYYDKHELFKGKFTEIPV